MRKQFVILSVALVLASCGLTPTPALETQQLDLPICLEMNALNVDPCDPGGGGGGSGGGGGTSPSAPAYRIQVDLKVNGQTIIFPWENPSNLVFEADLTFLNSAGSRVRANMLDIRCLRDGSFRDTDRESNASHLDVEFSEFPRRGMNVTCYYTAVHGGVTYADVRSITLQ